MKDARGNRAQGRTRWARFAAVMVPAMLMAGLLLVLMATGSIAASFAVSGQQFKVSADRLEGNGFAQYGGVDREVDGTLHLVAISAIEEAELRNLCQSVLVDTPLGEVTLKITAGDGDTPVTAENLFIDLEQLSGNAEFTNIEIGRDASTLDQVPDARGAPGMFGQQADRIVIDNLKQTALATNAGTFRLPGLHLGLEGGSHECFEGNP